MQVGLGPAAFKALHKTLHKTCLLLSIVVCCVCLCGCFSLCIHVQTLMCWCEGEGNMSLWGLWGPSHQKRGRMMTKRTLIRR